MSAKDKPAETIQGAFQEDKLDACKCGRDKAVYYCTDEKCPSKTSQPYYCLICLEEAKLHPHVPVRINKEINIIGTMW